MYLEYTKACNLLEFKSSVVLQNNLFSVNHNKILRANFMKKIDFAFNASTWKPEAERL